MPPLSGKELRTELTASLNDVRLALRSLAHICVEDEHHPASRASEDLADAANVSWWRGAAAVRNVHEDAMFLILAGLDHARSLSHSIRTLPDSSVSLATLTRGGVEAFARAYWLLSASTPLMMAGRDAALAYWDLEELSKLRRPKNSLQVFATKEKISPPKLREAILEWFAANALPKPARPGATNITSELIQASVAIGAEGTAGKQAYSDLSAVSHAQAYAINFFLQWDGDAWLPHERLSLRASDAIVLEYTAQLHAAMTKVGDTLVNYFVPTQRATDTWTEKRDRAATRRSVAHLG